jgi:transposase
VSQKRTEMDQLQELVRLHRMGTGCREVARLLAISPNTERQYREILAAEGLMAGPVESLPELAALKAAVGKHLGEKRSAQQTSSVERWSERVQAMLRKQATPKAIYDCLRLEEPEFAGSLSAIKRLYARLRGERPVEATDITIPVVSAPGEIAQVDFGYVGKLYDPTQGVLRKAWVFVMVLTYSRHLFARVVFDQRVTTWMALHVEAFARFGGVVETVVPDNLKAAVVRAAFGFTEQPALNRSYRELARHYGFKVDPTPPYSPEKKGGAESGVKYVKRNFFAPRDFADIDDANGRLDRWVEEIAGQRLHGTTHERPLDRFELEKPHLRALPPTRFECVQWKQVTVHTDAQIEFERRLYPVPWRLMGKQVWVQATPRTIAVYWEDTRVATHQRNQPVPPEVYDQYLPDQRSPLRYRSQSFWIARAERLGPDVVAYVREIFACDDVLSQLRTVQAVVTHLEKFPPARAQAACRRAQYYGNYTYPGVRDILRQGLDREPVPLAVVPAATATERPRYARRLDELLQLPLLKEDIDDAH